MKLKILFSIAVMLILISLGCNKNEDKETKKTAISTYDLLSKDFLKEKSLNDNRWIFLDEKINETESVKFFLDTLSIVRMQDTIQAWFKYISNNQKEDNTNYFFRTIFCKEKMFKELPTNRHVFYDTESLRMYREKFPIVPYSFMETFLNKYCK